MKHFLKSLVLLTLLLLPLPPAHAAAPARGDLYLVGIAIDQVGLTGSWIQLGQSAAWKDTNAATIFDGQLYTTENAGGLWTTNPNSGHFRQIGKPDFADTLFLFADATSLYTIEKSGNLFRVNPQTGAWTQIGANAGWKNTRATTMLHDHLFTIEADGKLWQTDLKSATFKQVGTALFPDTTQLVAAHNALFAIHSGGYLTRIDPSDGSTTALSKAPQWKLTRAAAILDNQLYTAESDGRLIITNLRTAQREQIGNLDFAATTYMLPVAGKLCTIESTGNLYYVSAGKDITVNSFNWCPEELDRALRTQGSDFYTHLHSKMLLGSAVTHTSVIDLLRFIERSTTPNDTVILFIDAHGNTDPNDGWGIYTADKKTLWGREIKIELAKLPCNAIVFDETCESGGFAQSHPNDPPLPPNVTAICACTAVQVANNQLDLALAEALYGRADYNHDSVVTLDELITYINTRYKEWTTNPSAQEASDTPVIVKSKNFPADFPLTRVSPNLAAVKIGDDFWSALIEKHLEGEGDLYQLHLLGWSSHPGEPYFLPNIAPRDNLVLPSDGPPILANQNNQWLPARFLSLKANTATVHLLGQNKDIQLPTTQLKYPFAATPN